MWLGGAFCHGRLKNYFSLCLYSWICSGSSFIVDVRSKVGQSVILSDFSVERAIGLKALDQSK